MQSKNKAPMTRDEGDHVERVKLLKCSVCDAGGGYGAPSEAHELKQGQWWTSFALCADCHRGSLLGIHGQRRAWLVRKMDETDALAVTIRRLMLAAYMRDGRAAASQMAERAKADAEAAGFSDAPEPVQRLAHYIAEIRRRQEEELAPYVRRLGEWRALQPLPPMIVDRAAAEALRLPPGGREG